MAKPAKKRTIKAKRTRSANHGSKSAFILSFPETTRAAEIVAAGAAKGLEFSAGYVSTTRSLDRKRKTKAGGSSSVVGNGRRASAAPASRGGRRRSAATAVDETLVQTILRYGVAKVEEALARVKAFRG